MSSNNPPGAQPDNPPNKPYKIRPQISTADRAKLNKYSDILAPILFSRGFETNEAAGAFINVDYDDAICDPFLLKDIDVATDRILRAISAGERICIYSDYDADGIPGAVVLSDFFKKVGHENFFVYLPHRNREGFGLNKNAIEKIAGDGDDGDDGDGRNNSSNGRNDDSNAPTLMITIDCGISDVEPVALAVERGIDVIITDHHDPNNHQTAALATINPRQPDCKYPDKNICGAGVIFKVVQALIAKGTEQKIFKNEAPVGWEKWLLDMVGIATLSDMVPLVGENRAFAKFGLTVMRKSPRKGFRRLLSECRVNQNSINEDDVAFSITPRINAASRMDEPEAAYKMLFTDDDVEADQTVRHLHKINDLRKGQVAAMVKEIKKEIEDSNQDLKDVPVIVKGNPKWQPSLLGLAASNIVEAYGRPVFLWGRGDGHDLKGSCRSDGSVNLVEMMNAVTTDVIFEFGGHEMAGGFSVSDEGVHVLREELEKAYKKTHNGKGGSQEGGVREIIVEEKLLIDDVTWDLFNDLEKLSPFGVGNKRPQFLFEKVQVADVQIFGKSHEHLKLIFKKSGVSKSGAVHKSFGKSAGNTISAIKFFATNEATLTNIRPGDTIDLIATLEKSNFGRYPELRLRVTSVIQ